MSDARTDPTLMPWEEVGKRVGLSKLQAQRIGDKAIKKLHRALQAACLDEEWLYNEFNILDMDEERYLALFLFSVAEIKCARKAS